MKYPRHACCQNVSETKTVYGDLNTPDIIYWYKNWVVLGWISWCINETQSTADKVSRLMFLHTSTSALMESSSTHHRVQQRRNYSTCLSPDRTQLHFNTPMMGKAKCTPVSFLIKIKWTLCGRLCSYKFCVYSKQINKSGRSNRYISKINWFNLLFNIAKLPLGE